MYTANWCEVNGCFPQLFTFVTWCDLSYGKEMTILLSKGLNMYLIEKCIMPLSLIICISFVSVFTGCHGAKGESPQEKRTYIDQMAKETLAELYKREPSARKQVENAVGYGVFSNMGMNLFVVATGNGYGLVHNRKTGEDIYMKMYQAGGGIGFGLEGFKGVFVFYDPESLRSFTESGWSVDAQANAAAVHEEEGGAVGVEATIDKGVAIYQFTETGVAVQATVKGTKIWKDKELN